MAFYELRQYKVRPGKIDQWVKIMEEEIIPFQVSKGMVICGSFRGETDPSVYVWLRRFESEKRARDALQSGLRDRLLEDQDRAAGAGHSRPRRQCRDTHRSDGEIDDAIALFPARDFVEAEARQPRPQGAAVAVADIQQEIRPPSAIGKERPVDLVGVEA